jgi:radical SAM protein with 4Fe4S-binding SPASM domain
MSHVRTVREASDDITLVARMTVASREPTLLDRVRELWELDLFDYFQIYPAVYRESGDAVSATGCASAPGEGRVVNFFLQDDMPDQFRAFLDAYPSFFAEGNRFRGVLEYERTAEMALEGRTALAFCSGGRVYYTHSPNGAISPCHRVAGDEDFDVGESDTGITRDHPEWTTSVDDHPVCSQCWARYLCGGGCKQENHLATGDINELNADSCAYQLLLAESVLKTVARAGPEYRGRDRALDDLFVSCGRPVVDNERVADPDGARLAELRFFRPVLRDTSTDADTPAEPTRTGGRP